ncbi:DNA-directed RNA polymerase III subunit RPC10-like [Narcine bancroftii]|uniref:DNA-directed RNA polymerase III subunit RPC10-like n=1 Tax=Narcine bancroftii TaxID=1343680 RepID=UPI00383148B2
MFNPHRDEELNQIRHDYDVILNRFCCIFLLFWKVTNRKYPKLKEVDDVLGGAAAWENVDSTAEPCPKCEHPRAYFMQIQTRSADEPMTTFYKCCNPGCGHRWRD